MKVWQGLGYYSRARNLHRAAQIIYEERGGKIPESYQELLKIPGIGPYTAAAVASFAFREAVPVVDGNVIRFLSRFFGLYLDPGQNRAKKTFHQKASEIIDRDRPDVFNQAIMDFGSTHCLRRNPGCDSCPFQSFCYAFEHGVVDDLPIRKERKKLRKRYFHYFVLPGDGHLLIRKREQKDIWQSLYEFPMVETDHPVSPGHLSDLTDYIQLLGKGSGEIIKHTGVFKHILSHQQIYARFYLVCLPGDNILDSTGLLQVEISKLRSYPLPRLLDKFLMEDTWADWISSYC